MLWVKTEELEKLMNKSSQESNDVAQRQESENF